MIIMIAIAGLIAGGVVFANEFGKFAEDVNPYNEEIGRYIKEIEKNPHIYCFNTCCVKECPKHKDNVVLDNQYLYALMKDTIYCPYQEEEEYELETETKE